MAVEDRVEDGVEEQDECRRGQVNGIYGIRPVAPAGPAGRPAQGDDLEGQERPEEPCPAQECEGLARRLAGDVLRTQVRDGQGSQGEAPEKERVDQEAARRGGPGAPRKAEAAQRKPAMTGVARPATLAAQ